MLQLLSMLEKSCNLHDRSLNTPVAADNLGTVDEALSVLTEYACGRIIAECRQHRGPSCDTQVDDMDTPPSDAARVSAARATAVAFDPPPSNAALAAAAV